MDWPERQRRFWDAVAENYSELYRDEWSGFEDDEIVALLRSIVRPRDTVVDFGCGQALGLALLHKAGVRFGRYIGLDLSYKMLSHASVRNSSGEFVVQANMETTPLADGSANVVMSLFSSMSYLQAPPRGVGELARVLMPGGQFLTMFLSRWSLHRLVQMKTGRTDLYGTKNLDGVGLALAPARFLSVGDLDEAFGACGMVIDRMFGQSPIGGSRGSRRMWGMSGWIGRICPNLGHSLVTVGHKPGAGEKGEV